MDAGKPERTVATTVGETSKATVSPADPKVLAFKQSDALTDNFKVNNADAPQGSCAPSSSLSVLVSGTDVVAYVPKGNWGVTLVPGIGVTNVEGSSVTPTLIPTVRKCIDYARRHVMSRGLPVQLTPLEFRLLDAFARHPGQVLSADQLIEHCWGHEAGVSRDQVKLYVSYVRKKLGQTADGWEPIETVRGFGYRYVPPSS